MWLTLIEICACTSHREHSTRTSEASTSHKTETQTCTRTRVCVNAALTSARLGLLVLDLPVLEGWKSELTCHWVVVSRLYTKIVYLFKDK